ncbi:transketolase-like protein 2 [Anabrus simplex]|uniref:transketolase-like protein 2 n=1 Tax=Anabrus simplex TaxID=316456 RepID=UPI0034DD13BA
MAYNPPDPDRVQELQDIANRLRIHTINATNAANSGHPTSCSSLAEVITVLFFEVMKYLISKPKDPSSDRFILSKGHAAPILYAAWAEAGLFLICNLDKLRKVDSVLEGHPTPRLSVIDVATGSLGQGLSAACGMAYVGKYFDNASYTVYCIVGDGESTEGAIWEALNFASHYKLDNLCVIFDINRLGQSEATALQQDMLKYYRRLESFGMKTFVVNGHDIEELCKAFYVASTIDGKPTAILAKTCKGKNFLDVENQEHWHGVHLGAKSKEILTYLNSLLINKEPLINFHPKRPVEDAPEVKFPILKLDSPPRYNLGDKVATRVAYGTALVKLATGNVRVIALDGDTKNSTFSEKLKKSYPQQYIECFIAEQNMVGVAMGAASRDRTIPFVSTFSAFLSRAFDQIRMAGISRSNIKFVGSHAGVTVGEDGPSQMGLEDIAMFRSIPGSVIFYPSDAVSCERAVELAANIKGICYIRTTKPATSVLYQNEELFTIANAAKILVHSETDRALVIGAGITVHEALFAAAELEKLGINIRVMDPFVIKPIDTEAIIAHAYECEGKIVTVEDHYPEGGLGEAVMSAVSEDPDIVVYQLAVKEIPRSGCYTALLEKYGIGTKNIVAAVLNICRDNFCPC